MLIFSKTCQINRSNSQLCLKQILHMLCEMDQKGEIKQEPVRLEGTASSSFPSARIKSEIAIEPQTILQLVPCIKEENVEESNVPLLSSGDCSNTVNPRSCLEGNLLLRTQDLRYHCSECSRKFSSNWAFEKHMLTHSENQPHYCIVCNSSFACLGTFQSNQFTNTGDKLYRCTECGSAFSYHLKFSDIFEQSSITVQCAINHLLDEIL